MLVVVCLGRRWACFLGGCCCGLFLVFFFVLSAFFSVSLFWSLFGCCRAVLVFFFFAAWLSALIPRIFFLGLLSIDLVEDLCLSRESTAKAVFATMSDDDIFDAYVLVLVCFVVSCLFSELTNTCMRK